METTNIMDTTSTTMIIDSIPTHPLLQIQFFFILFLLLLYLPQLILKIFNSKCNNIKRIILIKKIKKQL